MIVLNRVCDLNSTGNCSSATYVQVRTMREMAGMGVGGF